MHPNAEVRIYNPNINVGKSRSEQLGTFHAQSELHERSPK